MVQPLNYGITEEMVMLKDTARRFYSENYTTQDLHKLVANEWDKFDKPQCKWDRSRWQQMIELGWSSVAVSENDGGSGMPLVAAALLAEETGLAACPSPLLETLKSSYLLRSFNNSVSKDLLAEIVTGKSVILAVSGADGLYDSNVCEVLLEGDGPYLLNGKCYFVQDALKADWFIVKARAGEQFVLVKIPAKTEGLEIIPDVISDLTRDQAHLLFNNVVVADDSRIAENIDSTEVLANSVAAINVLIAADLIGSSEWLLQTTAEYARNRFQFDRPIGFYQAVKHPLVDAMVAIDEAKSLLYEAACAFDYEPEMALQLSHMTKAAAADAAAFIAAKAIQLHGGIAMTWECFVHIYVKRAKHNQFLYGDAVYHRAKLMEILLEN